MTEKASTDAVTERRQHPGEEGETCGPFLTISRQYGCEGFVLGLMVLDILNEQVEPPHVWRLYEKEILARLATETNLAAELLERRRLSKPNLVVDFFRSLSKDRIPSGLEVRERITTIIRGVAMEGYAILIGQGGAAATQDLPNGLSVRLEAPEPWRVRHIAFREGLTEAQARSQVRAMDEQRAYLRKMYEEKFPRRPAYHLTYDTSAFTLAQIARHIAHAMALANCLGPADKTPPSP